MHFPFKNILFLKTITCSRNAAINTVRSRGSLGDSGLPKYISRSNNGYSHDAGFFDIS